MRKYLFEQNIATIISPSGIINNIDERKEEEYHYQTFERINRDIIPGIIDDLVIDHRAFSGYNLSLIMSAKKYVVFMKTSPERKDELFLTIPSKITLEQYQNTKSIMKLLKEATLYVYICENNEDVDILFSNYIASYLMKKNKEKNIDSIKEIKIVDQKKNLIKKG